MTAATDPPSVRIQLLGPVRAWHGDVEIDLGTARRRAVFAILALSVNRAVSQAELVDGLWGEEPSSKAIGTLHTYIYDLRRALRSVRGSSDDTAVLTTQGTSYSLRVPAERIDEQLFLRHHEAAQQRWEQGDFAGAAAELDAATALWHGDSLEGLTVPFARLHRARLGELRLMARGRRAAARLAHGDHTTTAATIDELTDLVERNPLREGPRGLLMVALHRAGRDVEALRLFEDTEEVLVGELGIEPGPAMRRIREKIAARAEVTAADIGAGMWTPQDPGTAAVAMLSHGGGPEPAATFVGRTRELGLLQPMLTGLAGGHGGCLWVEGVLGMGKTALLAKGVAGISPDCRVVWSTADRLAGGAEPGDEAVDQTVALVAQACAQTPLVLVVEDLQGSEDKALSLWHRLARLTLRLPLLLVGLSRPVSPTSELTQLRNTVHAVGGRVLSLDALSPGTVAELVGLRTGARCGTALAERLASAGGNPLFVDQLLDMLTDAGALRIGDGVAELVDLDPSAEDVLESATTALLLRRLGFLAPRTHEMVRSAALLGTAFSVAEVAAVMRVSPVDLVGAVGEATATGVLVEQDRELEFRNVSVRRALYHEWPPKVRPLRHIEAARDLAAAGAAVDRVATQILAAAPALSEWAVGWLRDNIDAVSVQNAELAADLLSQAVVSVAVPEAGLEDLAVRRIRLLFQLGQTPTAETRAVLYRTADPGHAAELRWILAQLVFFDGEVDHALGLLAEVAESPDTPATWRARCQALRAEFEHTLPGGIERATRTASAALDLAEQTSDPASVAEALRQQWYLDSVRRDHEAALRHAGQALDVSGESLDLAVTRLSLLDNQAYSLQNLDRLDEATVTLERMRQIARRYRVRTNRPQVATAVHYFWIGHWDAAVAELSSVTDEGPGAAHLDRRLQTGLLHHGVTALVAAHRGDVETLRATLAAVDDTVPIVNTIAQENSDFLLVARAVDAGMRSGPAAELSAMDPLLDPDYGRMTLRHQWLPGIVRLALTEGDSRRVREALALCSAEAELEVVPARAGAAFRWCTALVDADPASLLVTARHFSEVGRPVEKASVLLDCAELIAHRGERERARQMFEEALAILTELGANRDLANAEARMRACGVSPRAVTPAVLGWHTLSDVERRVASLAAAAVSNSDIAAELSLSRREVQAHLSRTMQKLGASSRSDLADRLAHAVHESRGGHGTLRIAGDP
ncbi:BTAD domain-containing putative transcriptional regulator [Actinophytocola oryzae]|uniref:DNA-binding SARP family transcriptional activator n=1 Tax=Actinophytocola oryzae TaxID=502181 RepID=A0A4R7VHM6_9PSEU|nr:BTAD domain-containing putative transcriptional regulator [Actinophytocola oryzae]TDV48657.1 DNA-binding SARP family transcriptional activator [Actinophytocola oryzae]